MTHSPSPWSNPDPPHAAPWVRVLRWTPLGVVGACALLLTVSFVASQRATGQVVAGVRIAEIDVSRLTESEVRARLDAWTAQRASGSLAFTLAGSSLTFEPKNAGFQSDAPAAIEHALEVGHQGSLPARFARFISRWFRPELVPIAVRFDPALLERTLAQWQAQLKEPPFAGGVSFAGTTVTPLYAHPGTVLDRAAVELQLKDAVLTGHAGRALATRLETPKTDHAEVDRAVALAQSMLTNDVELVTADGARHLPLAASDIASVLVVTADAEHGKLELTCGVEPTRAFLESRRASLEQQPENARFVIDAQDHVRVEPGHAGLALDDAAVAAAVCGAAQSATKKGDLPLRAGAEPALSTEAAQHLGIVGLMGTYSTHHACCQPRVQNIHHIADLLDGTLVKPGETFSVNQVVGQRSVKNGFRLAPSIEDGDMVDTVGGGVSQFATTLFNALFYGGYDILERQPHTYWFTRYPMGYDATLSYPHPDIVFKNDTEAGALIKTSYTDTTITVKIYGDNGGRKVRAEVSSRQNIVSPPLEYIPNPHLDADEEKTREGGMIGWSVIVKRTLTFPDGKIKEERRKVTYKPRARRVEVHPCRIPEGEPGHTGERCPKPDPDKAASGATDTGATDTSAK